MCETIRMLKEYDDARKRWMDCVKSDMKIKGVSMEIRVIGENERRKHVVATPLSGIRGR
jgi:hypothetical protein